MNTQTNFSINIIIVCSLINAVFLTACGPEPLHPYSYCQPEQVDDGLDVGTLAEVNLDADHLESAVDDSNNGKYGEIHSMLVYKDGKLVFEEFFGATNLNGMDRAITVPG